MLSNDAIESFRRDGAVCLRDVFDEPWVRLLARGVKRNLADPGPHAKHYSPPGGAGFFFGDYCNWRRIEEYRRFVFDSPAASIAGQLMQSDKVNFFHEHVLVKEPKTAERTPWHHDQPYWAVDGNQVCSLWIPLDPVAEDVCVEFVAGSHRWGTRYAPRRFVDHADHPGAEGEAVPDIEARRCEFEILRWSLEPGDCIGFHALTLHGAPGNASPVRRRRAVATRWTGDDARFVRRAGFMSPPFEDVDLQPGAVMDSDSFPVVIPARQRRQDAAGGPRRTTG